MHCHSHQKYLPSRKQIYERKVFMSLFKRITRDEIYAYCKTSKHQPRRHISITIHHNFFYNSPVVNSGDGN